MDIAPNQVLFHRSTIQDGFMTRLSGDGVYDRLVDCTLKPATAKILLGIETYEYMDRYFPNWHILQRVEEHRRHPTGTPWKNIYYVIQVETDADAETLRSRLQKLGQTTS